jgi:hypothetical protein
MPGKNLGLLASARLNVEQRLSGRGIIRPKSNDSHPARIKSLVIEFQNSKSVATQQDELVGIGGEL